MSGKIKSKDLSYDSTLPPFLQRLKDQNAGRGDTDRHERAIARPMRAKDPSEDDGPTMVDESGEMLSKEEYEQLTKADEEARDEDVGGSVTGEVKDDAAATVSGALPGEEGRKGELKATSGMGAKKRKAAKVVGDEEGDEQSVTAKKSKDEEPAIEKKAASKSKRKAKPIKLAFDDGEEG